ncbi:MAG TPA: hypothetical protein DD697_01110 [Candidatus Komeilibacteria bacterium]|uniref:Ribbon-helix-helix protein CopG domain-containing protein n=2 Tax=Candidatus Beckwithiibacteriota TaxID=1752726 RepID=A0A1F5DW96_9BACT|nr:MAG: hypothetical protein A3E73_00255 [Candidatus Beckwithbacteria bacterium RIFCSPHIGHO2_12_FULL_47_17]OGD59291.1 MAG: hypothetical protein A3I57_02000 [Candidatus Beckwithbacteria bacterium RIFCSPLOWO2_02_FULL_47_23]HBR13285.1 hypothetical protein [Candidatus Komeilibacteria bacterium]
MLNKRVNFLFDEEMLMRLRQMAAEESVSVGDLVRKAVKKTYADKDAARLKRINQACREIERVRTLQKNINYKELINAGRKY